jgi:hypothetical protein
VAEIVADRLADGIAVARQRPVSIARSLAYLALATPALDPATATAARQILATDARAVPGAGLFARLRRWLTRRRSLTRRH